MKNLYDAKEDEGWAENSAKIEKAKGEGGLWRVICSSYTSEQRDDDT